MVWVWEVCGEGDNGWYGVWEIKGGMGCGR